MRRESKRFEKGFVSVVMPVFNGENYVSGLLRSVLEQTYPHVKRILVDDGSEDRTVSIAEGYREQFARRGCAMRLYGRSTKRLGGVESGTAVCAGGIPDLAGR